MEICIATSEEEIKACFPVMRELRPLLEESEFLPKVKRQESQGYVLAYLKSSKGRVCALAGFRILEGLSRSRYLYVDDLVTLENQRSMGYGKVLLSWIRDYALSKGCKNLHLDSGIQRKDAHRFYEREGMSISSYHFSQSLESG